MNEFNVGRDAIGFIFSAQYVTTVLGTILFGEIANHFGRKIALFYSVLWDALLTALTALAPNNFYTGFSQNIIWYGRLMGDCVCDVK